MDRGVAGEGAEEGQGCTEAERPSQARRKVCRLKVKLRRADICQELRDGTGNDALRHTANALDHKRAVQRDNAVGANPARGRQRAGHEVGRRQCNGVFRLRP